MEIITMRLENSFDINDLPQSTSNDPLPAGEYPVSIERVEVRATKAGNGSYLSIMYRVIGPNYTNACVFGNLNIVNQNAKAEEIGRQQLGSLMRSCGLVKLGDTDELIGRECIIRVAVKEDAQYGPRNEVKSFKSYGSSAPAVGRNGQTASPRSVMHEAAASSQQPSPPWVRK
jgi:hypothetical protein